MRIDRFSDFKVNEIFGIVKSLPYDGIAKENFKKLLDNLEDVKVNKYADYKREVLINLKSKKSEEANDKVQEGQVVGLKKKNTSVSYSPQTSIHDAIKKSDYSNVTKIEIMKNYSKHRKSSNIFGVGKEDTYSLSINGKHFISDIRGEEGKVLVSNKISKAFWELLSELSVIQEDFRRRLIKEDVYKKKLSDLKNKYTNWFNKLK